MRHALTAVPVALTLLLLFSPVGSAHETPPPPQAQPTCSISASLVRGEPGQNPLDLRVKWEVTAPENISVIKADIIFQELPKGAVYKDTVTTNYTGTKKTESGFRDFRVNNVNAAHKGLAEITATLVDPSTCSRNLQIRIAKR